MFQTGNSAKDFECESAAGEEKQSVRKGGIVGLNCLNGKAV